MKLRCSISHRAVLNNRNVWHERVLTNNQVPVSTRICLLHVSLVRPTRDQINVNDFRSSRQKSNLALQNDIIEITSPIHHCSALNQAIKRIINTPAPRR